MHATEKYLQGQKLVKKVSNQQKLYTAGHGEFEIVSIMQMVRVSHAFVYNMINVNKIIAIILTKPLSYMNAQLCYS